jgi:hypothetical protein
MSKADIDIIVGSQHMSVNYQIVIDGKTIEIEGSLIPYHTGRCKEFNFEPSVFLDTESSMYWDANWEQIEQEILNQIK